MIYIRCCGNTLILQFLRKGGGVEKAVDPFVELLQPIVEVGLRMTGGVSLEFEDGVVVEMAEENGGGFAPY